MTAEDVRSHIDREQLRIALAGWPFVLFYATGYSAIYIFLDLFYYEDDKTNLFGGFVVWAAGYFLLLRLMEKAGYLDGGKKSGLGTYFVLGIAVLLGVLVGFVALIVPGIYLSLRWLPAYADALRSGGSAGAALRRSWRMTEGAWMPLALAAIYPGVLFFVGIGLGGAAAFEPSLLTTGIVVTYNVALSMSVAWFTVLGIASLGVLSESNPCRDLSS